MSKIKLKNYVKNFFIFNENTKIYLSYFNIIIIL